MCVDIWVFSSIICVYYFFRWRLGELGIKNLIYFYLDVIRKQVLNNKSMKTVEMEKKIINYKFHIHKNSLFFIFFLLQIETIAPNIQLILQTTFFTKRKKLKSWEIIFPKHVIEVLEVSFRSTIFLFKQKYLYKIISFRIWIHVE